MTTAPAAPAQPVVRRATRDLGASVLGGVAAGLARHLDLPAWWVRAAFVVSALAGGLGVALYVVLWLMLPVAVPVDAMSPGLESATRGGRRPGRRPRLRDLGPVAAFAALGVGVLLVVNAVVGVGTLLWPAAVGLAGLALLWWQADEAQRERWLDTSGRVDVHAVVLGDGGWRAYGRLVAGVGLVVVSFALFALRGGSLSLARDLTVAAALGVVGIGIVVGPWIYRLAGELAAERAERVRTQERADVAAHLHDSVLQTLALIQQKPGDATTVARLARAQERDLRAWLYAGETLDEASVASALRTMAAEVEDTWGIAVDVVAVGDVGFEEHLRPIVAAAREATTNAAKHAGVARVDVYVEVSPSGVDVFVRDRGTGFDVAAVPEGRHGVRHSIVDRMERHGGRSEIRTAPGSGTEVRLHLPLRTPERAESPDPSPDSSPDPSPDPEGPR